MSLWPTSEVEYNPRPFLSSLLTLCKLPNSSACYILASSHFEAVSQPSVFFPSCARCDVHHVTGSSKYWIVCVCIKEGMVKNPSDNKWLSALCNISSLSGDTRLVSCCSPNTKKAPESFSGIISQPFFAEKKKKGAYITAERWHHFLSMKYNDPTLIIVQMSHWTHSLRLNH